jgi:hypothetical protein
MVCAWGPHGWQRDDEARLCRSNGGLVFDAFDERGGFIVDDACLAAVEAVAARGIRDVVEAQAISCARRVNSPRGSVSITSGAMRP